MAAATGSGRPATDFIDRVAYYLKARGLEPQRDDDRIAKTYGVSCAAGWHINLPITGGVRSVDVILPLDYPFSRPRIGVANVGEDFMPFAHVEQCGLLCLEEQERPHQISSDEAALARALDRAATLLALNPENLAKERRGEFINYWSFDASTRALYSILDDTTPFGLVSTWSDGPFGLIAATDDIATAWLRRRFGDGKVQFKFQPGLYLSNEGRDDRLSDASNLPNIAAQYADIKNELPKIALAWNTGTIVVFRLAGDFALVAAQLHPPPPQDLMVKKQRYPGFRPGREPPSMAMEKFFATGAAFEHLQLQRADAAWVLARGGESFNDKRFEKHVCLIGAGSLGSEIARTLVKSGIGHLTIIDPDHLAWDNIARHALGAQHIGESKAGAMEQELMMDYPFVKVRGIAARWQDAFRDDRGALHGDLVISTTGSWPDEAQLNALFREEKRAETLAFGWLEAHAAAAHVLVMGKTGGCLACGMNSWGQFSHSATEWEQSQLRAEASCGNMYAPYADLTAWQARILISNQVLQALVDPPESSHLTTQIFDRRLWEQFGGTVRPDVAKRLAREPNPAGERWTQPWEVNPECHWCNAR